MMKRRQAVTRVLITVRFPFEKPLPCDGILHHSDGTGHKIVRRNTIYTVPTRRGLLSCRLLEIFVPNPTPRQDPNRHRSGLSHPRFHGLPLG